MDRKGLKVTRKKPEGWLTASPGMECPLGPCGPGRPIGPGGPISPRGPTGPYSNTHTWEKSEPVASSYWLTWLNSIVGLGLLYVCCIPQKKKKWMDRKSWIWYLQQDHFLLFHLEDLWSQVLPRKVKDLAIFYIQHSRDVLNFQSLCCTWPAHARPWWHSKHGSPYSKL